MNNIKKIYKLLSSKHKLLTIILLVLMVGAALMEMIGIVVLVPAFSTLNENNIIYKKISERLNFANNLEPIYIITIFVLFIFLVKNIFLSFVVFFQARFCYNIQIDITKKVFFAYMSRDYEKIMNNSPNYYISKIINESNSLANTLFLPLINIITEVIVGIGILTIIFVANPDSALIIIFTLTLTSGIYYSYAMKRNKLLGKAKFKYERTITGVVEQAFKFIKELKIYGLQKLYVDKFSDSYVKKRNIEIHQATLSTLPRMVLEFSAIIALIGVIVTLTIKKIPEKELVSTLIIVAASAFRMLPSYNRIVAALGSVKYSENLLNEIFNLIISHSEIINTKIEFKNSIKFKNIYYERGGVGILKDINFEIFSNKLIGIYGASGSGKTTILDLLSGIIHPTKGEIYIDNVLVDKIFWNGDISYVTQENLIYDSTLQSNIIMNIKYDENHFLDSIKCAELTNEYLKHGKKCKVSYLSGGQKQRVLIARAIYRKTSLILMDEPTSALDSITADKIIDNLIKLSTKATIIIVTHDLKLLNRCNQIIRI